MIELYDSDGILTAITNIDDVGFINTLLDELESTFAIDIDKVYATGLSNGAMMVGRLACDLSERITAISPVSGTYNYGNCNPLRPVPVMIFHGTADTRAPYDGGIGSSNIVPRTDQSVSSAVDFWKGTPLPLYKKTTKPSFIPSASIKAGTKLFDS